MHPDCRRSPVGVVHCRCGGAPRRRQPVRHRGGDLKGTFQPGQYRHCLRRDRCELSRRACRWSCCGRRWGPDLVGDQGFDSEPDSGGAHAPRRIDDRGPRRHRSCVRGRRSPARSLCDHRPTQSRNEPIQHSSRDLQVEIFARCTEDLRSHRRELSRRIGWGCSSWVCWRPDSAVDPILSTWQHGGRDRSPDGNALRRVQYCTDNVWKRDLGRRCRDSARHLQKRRLERPPLCRATI